MARLEIDPRRIDAVVVDVESAPTREATSALVRMLGSLAIRTSTHDGGAPGLQDQVRRLGARATRAAAIVDSVAASTAARSAGFAVVVGVSPDDRAGELLRAGADVVVPDVGDIGVRTHDRRMSEIPNALSSRHQATTILRTRHPVVFLDFDGTLAPIVSDPAAAVPAPRMTDELIRLSRYCQLAVISGRDLADVQARVGVPGIWYAGSHGFELVGPDGQHYRNEEAAAAAQDLDRATEVLEVRLAGIPGVVLERKGYGLTVHYRNVDEDRVSEVVSAVQETGAASDRLRVANGRMVVELQPDVDWDKGKAVLWVLDHIEGSADLLPVFIGDDLTDEDAFDAVSETGVGIVVRHTESGDRPSAAQFSVDSPLEVRELLQRLADLLGSDPSTIPPPDDPWTVFYEGYDPPEEKLREVMCTVGNGYLATRGCAPESHAGTVHYPGTYAAGIFNRLHDEVDGVRIDNESMVNLPNWLPTTFRIEGGPWFDVDSVDLLEYRQYLDLRRAVLTRRLRFEDAQGRVTSVVQRRFAAMHFSHACALETTVVPENWSGRIEFRSLLDGSVQNTLVERYRSLSSRHLSPMQSSILSDDAALLVVQTNQSRVPVAMAARSSLWRDHQRVESASRLFDADGRVGHDFTVDAEQGESVTLEKIVTVFTGRDHATSEPGDAAVRWLDRLDRFDTVLEGHVLAWANVWDSVGVELDGHGSSLRIVRLHLLHMLQTVSPNTADLDAGVPARGLHGEAYRGHIFWDELFVFPVLNLRLPTLTRSLLRYRHRRLREARRAAIEAGWSGAMFPWQSGSDGREESQKLHLNPNSGRWLPDPSQRQHHIGIAVAYNVWQYFQVTGDLEFLIATGAEMLAEIARFYASLATFDESRGRYVIRGVIGPDEFHSGYPEAPYDGVDNNAYTNVMAVWVILRAIETLELLPVQIRADLTQALGLHSQEIAHWTRVCRRMFVPFLPNGIISQFEGYGELAELDWAGYRQLYGDIQRLDRILEAEGDDVNRYQASKQADVLMLYYLLSVEELRELLSGLGYALPSGSTPRTIDYYLLRTSHGSTLSSVVHAWVLARSNRSQAMEFFDRVLKADITDIQGGTTSEGIHLAAMAGSVDLVQRCFSGMEARGGRLLFAPHWPETLGTLEFPIFYRGSRLLIQINGRRVQVTAAAGNQPAIEVECRGEVAHVVPGSSVVLG